MQRDAYRDARLRMLARTLGEVLRGGVELPELRLVDDVGAEHRRPAVLLVSNNPYTVGRAPSGRLRAELDGGRLGIVVLDPPSAAPPTGRAWTAESLEVGAPANVHAGLDGEAVELEAPLRFAIRPLALRVRIAARQAR